MRSLNPTPPNILVRLMGSTLLGLLPFVAHVLPINFGSDVLFTTTGTFLSAFAICGIAAGAKLRYVSIMGGPLALVLALAYLTNIGFVGGGGDGDLFYLLATGGAAVFSGTALLAAVLRPVLRRVQGT